MARVNVPWERDRVSAYRPSLHEAELDLAHTALLVMDLQAGYVDCDTPFAAGLARSLPDEGASYFDRLQQVTLPNVHRLVDRFRLLGLPVVFTRLGTLLQDGADLPAWSWRRVQQPSAPDGTQPLHHVGSPEHALIEEFQPMPSELVVDRPTYNPFNSSALEQTLRNMGVLNLMVAGLLTEVAVETTARSAGERGFWVILVEDACATLSAEEHAAAVSGLAWCVPRSTDEVLALLTPQAILL